MTHALRPWTIDFHVAQNDATVKGSGSHDKTGRHCLPTDPNGKLDIVRHAGYWLRDDIGEPTRAGRAHLLGRLHVPERDDGAAGHLERRAEDDGQRPQRARLELGVWPCLPSGGPDPCDNFEVRSSKLWSSAARRRRA